MVGPEHAPDIMDGLPNWARIAADLGMFAVAIAGSAFGFMRHLSGSMPAIGTEAHPDDSASHCLSEDIRAISSSVERIARAAESLVKMEEGRDRESTIEREVTRRLHDKH